jgi:hypothetical protein
MCRGPVRKHLRRDFALSRLDGLEQEFESESALDPHFKKFFPRITQKRSQAAQKSGVVQKTALFFLLGRCQKNFFL